MAKYKVMVVDDHEVVVKGIRSLLSDKDQFEICGEAYNGRQAIDMAAEVKPDIIIMDISMPIIDGVEATREIRRSAPGAHIIVYTMYSEAEWVLQLFKEGISAYVLKDGPIGDLMLALQAVESGGTYFSSVAPAAVVDHLTRREESPAEINLGMLSTRELEVFKLLADGRSIKGIAEKLFISPRTVETHKYNIMKKLGVDSLTELTKIAIKHKLIEV